jgi:hypothetical protein
VTLAVVFDVPRKMRASSVAGLVRLNVVPDGSSSDTR